MEEAKVLFETSNEMRAEKRAREDTDAALAASLRHEAFVTLHEKTTPGGWQSVMFFEDGLFTFTCKMLLQV